MYARHGSKVINGDERLTFAEFRDRVKDESTPLDELIARVNQEDRPEFAPTSVRKLAIKLHRREVS